MKYDLLVTVAPNPDHRQRFKRWQMRIVADTFHTLLDDVGAFQCEHELGGGNWESAELRCDGKTIGWMSYNGRVWDRKSCKGQEEVMMK